VGRRKKEEKVREKEGQNEQEPCKMEVTTPNHHKESLLNGNCPHSTAHCQPRPDVVRSPK
jgi:hypothetical protein